MDLSPSSPIFFSTKSNLYFWRLFPLFTLEIITTEFTHFGHDKKFSDFSKKLLIFKRDYKNVPTKVGEKFSLEYTKSASMEYK